MPLINFSGLASGIDSEALIEATIDARRATRVTPKEEEISELEGEKTALEELKTQLDELKDLLLDFTDINGGGVAKSVTSSDETAVTAIASNSANSGTYTITSISQLATNHTYTFAETTADTGAAVLSGGQSGDFVFQIGSAPEETVTINMDDTTTWNELAAEFNSTTDLATAQLINTAAPGATASYSLVITSNNVGEERGLLAQVNTGDVATALTAGSESAAQNSIFTLSGVGAIERSSNTINDVIDGVTLSLETDLLSSNVTLQVGTDTSSTESAVNSFIEKYNEIVVFIDENNLVTREENGQDVTNIFGPLANTRVDDGVLSSLRTEITASTYNNTGDSSTATNAIRIFADLGITTDRDGTLAFDTDDFQEAINDEPDSVNEILQNFANATSKTGELIEQYTRFNGLIDNVVNSNDDRVEDLNDQIARAEEFITREADQIRARFARLEATISELQSQQQALTSALAGLGGGG